MIDGYYRPDEPVRLTRRGCTDARTDGFLAKLAKAIGYVRLRPFDTRSAKGRSDERHRRILLTASSALVAKAASGTVSLLTVPLTVSYLGAER